MTGSKKRYDSKHKLTRILLSDYLMLKELSKIAGVSMAEALHELITGQDHKTPIHPAQIPLPVTMAKATPVFQVKPQPIIAINGNKTGIFIVKPKGGIIK